MKFLVRQTYTMASLVAMLPAGIWAVCDYSSNTIIRSIGVFPYIYLVVCQLMIVPRYTISAAVVYWLGRKCKTFDSRKACISFIGAGILIDTWVTYAFARGIALPPEENWSIMIPLFAFGYGLLIMLAAALAGGFIAPMLRRPR